MKRNIFIYSALSMAMLATFSCSDDTTLTDLTNSNKEAINFAPVLDNGGVVTRAHNGAEALNMGYTVWLENNGNGNLKLKSDATYNTTDSKYSFNPALYWDDISADKGSATDAQESDVRKGATVKVWAAQFAGKETSNYSVSEDHKITWNIDAAQATNGYEKNDLLVADYIAEQKAIDGTTKQTIPLCFHHAMTKITINVIQGEGFAVGDASSSTTNEITGSTTTVTLKSQNTKATIDLSKAKGDGTDADMVTVEEKTGDASNAKDITMKAATSGYQYKYTDAEGKVATANAAASFDAIVVEGKELEVTSTSATDFAEIKIKSATNNSAYNTYNVPITAEVLKAWNGGTAPTDSKLILKHGVHYILNVTVKKQGIELTAVLAPWTEYTASTVGEITFNPGTTNSTGTGEAFTKAFTIWSSTNVATGDTQGTGYTVGSTYTYTEANGYTTTAPMYWADNNDKRYFRTALYESATSTSTVQATISEDKVSSLVATEYVNTADLIWGASVGGNTPCNPTTQKVNLQFIHALSQVTVKLKTADKIDGNDAPDAIDLTKVSKVEITGTKTSGGTMSLHDGTISIAEGTEASNLALSNNSTTENAKYETSKTYLVLPQTFAVNTTENNKLAPKIVITMNDGTTFSVSLAEIHKALKKGETNAGQASNQGWLQGEKYEYTITITKQKIDFAASIKDWETKTGSGNATMDWD